MQVKRLFFSMNNDALPADSLLRVETLNGTMSVQIPPQDDSDRPRYLLAGCWLIPTLFFAYFTYASALMVFALGWQHFLTMGWKFAGFCGLVFLTSRVAKIQSFWKAFSWILVPIVMLAFASANYSFSTLLGSAAALLPLLWVVLSGFMAVTSGGQSIKSLFAQSKPGLLVLTNDLVAYQSENKFGRPSLNASRNAVADIQLVKPAQQLRLQLYINDPSIPAWSKDRRFEIGNELSDTDKTWLFDLLTKWKNGELYFGPSVP